jgi:hypothetical protein
MPRSFDALYLHVLEVMEHSFLLLEARVPKPVRVCKDGGFVFRYQERTAEQAIVQRLVRIITGLKAALLLHQNGLIQEVGMVQRALDEFTTDIQFLNLCVTSGEPSEHFQRFLSAFFDDTFESSSGGTIAGARRPDQIRRKQINAYVARMEAKAMGKPLSNQEAEAANHLGAAYSGFVHGASHIVFDIYGGWPPHYHIEGAQRTPMAVSVRNDLWNYFFRGLVSYGFAAHCLGDNALFEHLCSEVRIFEDTHPTGFPK